MFTGRFYIGWFLSAVLMYLAFYFFHGIITNDILKLSIPKNIFLSVAAIVYLLIALGMSMLFKSTSLKKAIQGPYKRGLLIGFLTALFLYGVAFTVGISFSFNLTMLNILVDVGWQLVEQGIGAFVIAISHTFLYYEEAEHSNYL